MPAAGPTSSSIVQAERDDPKPSFIVVKINEHVTNVVGQFRPPSFSSFFKVSDVKPDIVLEVGDKVTVNIFEAGGDGLFSSTTSKATQIQAQIDATGTIFVPYVGAVQAANRSVDSVRRSIESALEDKAIQPQVQLLVAQSLANSVTVLGDVKNPGIVPVEIAGLRILDLIASAGGAVGTTYQTRVILRRGTTVATADLEDLFDNPKENVAILPGDTILVSDDPKTFTVLGATSQRSEYKFDSRRVTLAEALGRAGGLSDTLADAKGVFLFRFEPDGIAKQLNERADTVPSGTMVPVVYRLDLADPQSLFLAQLFELRDEDMIYVATHPSAQLGKFLQIVGPAVSTATTVATLQNRFGN
ncbi:polysaccharide export protein [Acuticoccus sp. M5D2P5]|uniref:polysaccharide biosynthesis/export family protein n=1 Tax=Acuticoccus kalidii TaxID=2910977 RepID=UPI001F3C12D6|nr:polysaccharide biosynthesis/export family protein [Acuticoccus kalidii]MCF3936327.1 polysaccharide export protein [Acuticoccus kalidii]